MKTSGQTRWQRLPVIALAALVAVAAACGGDGNAEPTATAPPPTATAAPRESTPTATATALPRPTHAPSTVSDVRAEATAPDEVTVSFAYHLELAPEQNAIIHLGYPPVLGVALLDAAGGSLGRFDGELDPTEFGIDEVSGTATVAVPSDRFADLVAVEICIRVWTGGGGSQFGLSDELCEPFAVEKVE